MARTMVSKMTARRSWPSPIARDSPGTRWAKAPNAMVAADRVAATHCGGAPPDAPAARTSRARRVFPTPDAPARITQPRRCNDSRARATSSPRPTSGQAAGRVDRSEADRVPARRLTSDPQIQTSVPPCPTTLCPAPVRLNRCGTSVAPCGAVRAARVHGRQGSVIVTSGVRLVAPLRFSTMHLLWAVLEGHREQPPSHRRSIRRSLLGSAAGPPGVPALQPVGHLFPPRCHRMVPGARADR